MLRLHTACMYVVAEPLPGKGTTMRPLFDHTFRWAMKGAVETLLTRPNPLLAALLSKNQVEPITMHDLEEWWTVLPEMGYRPNTLEAAAFIIGVRHGRHNDNSAPWFVRWTTAQVEAGEKGWIYGRSRVGRPVLYPVLQFTPDPRLQFV